MQPAPGVAVARLAELPNMQNRLAVLNPASPQGPSLGSGDTGGFIFPDLSLAGFSWYVPTFEDFRPENPNFAPFSFEITASGHDQQGALTIDAKITVAVRPILDDSVRAQLPDPTRAAPVQITSTQASLVVPFRDSTSPDAPLTTTSIAATSTTPFNDGYMFTFQMSGALARAAYGSLSHPGFQSQPCLLSVQYTFAGFVQPWRLPIIRPLQTDTGPPPGGPHRFVTHIFNESPAVAARVLMAADAFDVRPNPALAELAVANLAPAVSPSQRVAVTRTQTGMVLVPCDTFGQLYVDSTDPQNPHPIGCQDAMTLGELPNRRYTQLDNLSTDDYLVYAAVDRPGVYLLIPRRYRVGRAAPGQPGMADWSPLIRWIQEFDATHDTSLPCRLQANLQPDISKAAYLTLLSALAQQTHNPNVRLMLPTSFGSGLTSFNVTGWNTAEPIQVTTDGDFVQINLDTSYTDAVILNGMLSAVATEQLLVGNVSCTFDDGTTIAGIELHLDIARLTGPWPDGPISVIISGSGTAVVANHAENAATVTQILAHLQDGTMQPLAVQQSTDGGVTEVASENLNISLNAGASSTVALSASPPPGAEFIAAYSLADATTAVIGEENIYIEDLHTTITVVNDVNYQAGITSIDVTARLDTDAQNFTFTFTSSIPLFQFDLVQPLVADRQSTAGLLHLAATVHKTGQPDVTTGDYVADLHTGVIFQLSEVIATK